MAGGECSYGWIGDGRLACDVRAQARIGIGRRLHGISVGAVGFAHTCNVCRRNVRHTGRANVCLCDISGIMRRPCFRRCFLVLSSLGASQWKQFVQWPVLKFYGDISYGLLLDSFVCHHPVQPAAWEPSGRSFRGPPGVGILDNDVSFAIYTSCATGLAFLSRLYFESRSYA